MDKYSGMNKVQSRVAANDQIVNKKKPQGGGFLKTLFVQTLICLAIGAALFVGKFVDIKYHAAAAEMKGGGGQLNPLLTCGLPD